MLKLKSSKLRRGGNWGWILTDATRCVSLEATDASGYVRFVASVPVGRGSTVVHFDIASADFTTVINAMIRTDRSAATAAISKAVRQLAKPLAKKA